MQEVKIEDYERRPVPQDERKSWRSISLVWIAIGIDLSAMLLGAELGGGMDFYSALLAVFVGSLFLGVLASFCAYIGSATGLSTSMISRFAFGEYGARIVSVIIGISLLGWFGVQAGFFAENAYAAFEHLFGSSISTRWLALFGGLLMMTTAIYGYKAIERLSVYSVPFLVALILLAMGLAINKEGSGALFAATDNTFSFGAATSLVIGIFVLGAMISPDVSRWAKSRKDAVLAAFFGFFIGNSFMLVMAIILSKILDTDDLTYVFFAVGLGIPAILVLTLAQWTTNTNNLYSSSLGFSVVFRRTSKVLITIIAGLVATMLAVFGIYDRFITFLSIITMFIAPVGGIYTAEYYLINRKRFSFENEEIYKLNICALITWVISTFISYMTTDAPDGLGLFTITTVPALDGFFSAFILQILLSYLIKNEKWKVIK